MAKTRHINTRFWDDDFVTKLEPSGKLLFLYFLSNPLTDLCGAYEVTMKRIAFDTGLKVAKIQELLEHFEAAGKIAYRDGWVLIRNFAKHQQGSSPNVKKGAERSLNACPNWVKQTLSKGWDSIGMENALLPIPIGITSGENLTEQPEPTAVAETAPRNRDLVLIEWFDAIAPVMGAKNRFGLTRQAAWKSVCHICISEGYKPPELVSAIQRLLDAPKFETKYFTPEKALDELRVNKNGKTQSSKLPSVAEKLAADQAARNAPRPKPPMRRVPPAGQIDSNVSNGDRPA